MNDYNFSDYNVFSVTNHFELFLTLAVVNAILSFMSLCGLGYFLAKYKHLLKKSIYQLYFVSLLLSFAGNFISLFRVYVWSDMTQTHFQLLLALLNATIVALFSILWLMFWNLIAIYRVLDVWLERIMPSMWIILVGACSLETVLFLVTVSVTPMLSDIPKYYVNGAHVLFLMCLGVVASVSSLALLIHVVRLLEQFHREKRKQMADTYRIRRLQHMIIACAIGLMICCLSIVPFTVPNLSYSYTFEFCSVCAIFLSMLSSMTIHTFQLTVSLALAKRYRPKEVELEPQAPAGEYQPEKAVKIASMAADTVMLAKDDQPTVILNPEA